MRSLCGLEIYSKIVESEWVLCMDGRYLIASCVQIRLGIENSTQFMDSHYSNSLCTRVAGHGNTLYFNTIWAIMLVRCYGTYSLLCNHLDNLWLEDLSNNHVICSNSSSNQTLYRAWMNVALTEMATWGLKIYWLCHALQFVLGLSVAHAALTHTDTRESDTSQKQYIFQFVLVSHRMSNTCLSPASSQ